MGQQPNFELTDAAKPRLGLQPAPSAGWRSDKPGIPQGPGDVPKGGTFGMTGPDPGWASKLVAGATLPDDSSALAAVVTGLVMARAAAAGRASVPEDIEAALAYCGYYEEAPRDVVARRERWLAAVPHDAWPGQTAVAEVDRELLSVRPERIRWAFRLTDQG